MVAVHEWKEVLLTIENVCLRYDGQEILKGVNAQIRNVVRPGLSQGQVVGFLGPSGIGKTQLFRIMAGIQRPSSGRVLVTSKQVAVSQGLVGVVAQNYPLFSHRTVLGNLMVAAHQRYKSGEECLTRSMGLLKRFGLGSHAKRYPVQLSGGQRQRVAIAQQLLCSDHFLLMDEPFSGLDPLMVDEVVRLITEVGSMDEENTIIVVTHDIPAAISVADTLWLMGRERDEQGNIIPGARIVSTYDLIERGLAWQMNVTQLPEFAQCVREVRDRFRQL